MVRHDECQLVVPKFRTAKDVVKIWLGKVGSCVPKGQLPIYMQLVDVFLSGNVYPIGTHYEKRGVMLEELYKLHVGEWVDLNNMVIDYFEKFFENMIEKRLDRNLQPHLKFPRLITQLLESKGYKVPSEEEKVEVKTVYRVEDWRKTINRSKVILQNSTTSVQHIPPTEEPCPTL